MENKENVNITRFNNFNQLFDLVEEFKPIKIATYAKLKGVSVQAIYKQIKAERIVHIVIDGQVFLFADC